MKPLITFTYGERTNKKPYIACKEFKENQTASSPNDLKDLVYTVKYFIEGYRNHVKKWVPHEHPDCEFINNCNLLL